MIDEELPLPSAPQAEAAVIASILKRPSLLAEVVEEVTAADFFSPSWRSAFSAMTRLAEKDAVIDFLTVSDEAGGEGGLSLGMLAELDLGQAVSHSLSHARLVAEAATKRRLIDAAQQIAEMAWRPGVRLEDVETRADALLAGARSATRGASKLWSAEELAEDFLERLERRMEGELPGVSTGLRAFDKATLGLYPGRLYLLPARPGMGKSVLMWQIALHVAKTKPVLVASVEMTGPELADRGIAFLSGVDPQRIALKTITNAEMVAISQAAAAFAALRVTVDDADYTARAIRAKALRLQAQEGQLGLIAVDYGQLLKDSAGQQATRDENQGQASGLLKQLAKDLKVPVLVPVQINRKAEDRLSNRIPQLSDIRDSGNWEQDADVVLTPFRDDYYDSHKNPGQALLVVLKQRHEGLGAGQSREMWWSGGRYVDHQPVYAGFLG